MDDDVDVEGDTELLMDIVFCLAGSDTDLYPLTRDVLTEFVEKLGGKMPVIVEADERLMATREQNERRYHDHEELPGGVVATGNCVPGENLVGNEL